MKNWVIGTFILALASATSGNAQQLAVKSNALADAILSPNVGVEYGFAPQWSAELTAEVNAWTLSDDHRWKHWFLQPELRYWLCDRFSGHFFGAHIYGGQYNIGKISNNIDLLGTHFSRLKNSRYQGWMVGAGVAYGYAWILSRHWNLEAELGLGYAYTRYDRFRCSGCGKKIESDKAHNYVGPTKAAVNLVYTF